MRDVLKKKGILIAAAAIVIALISVISSAVGNRNNDVTSNTVNILIKPVKSLISSLVDDLEQVYSYMYEYDQVVAENQELKEQVAQLEEEYREYTEISDENERLRKLLELSQRHSDFKYETANIISWSSSNWSSSFTINKGSSAGLSLNDCIITENGYLVGQITSLSSTTATVTTILDTTSNVGALVYETSEAGIAAGDFALMRESKLALTYLSGERDLVSGYTLVTSGKGGMYPQGLVIGTITDFVISSSGLDNYAVIEPSVDFGELTHVYVITDYEVTK